VDQTVFNFSVTRAPKFKRLTQIMP